MHAKQLLQFSTIADAGSISEAANRLNLAQPALSLAISNLEEELGAKLFIRHRRGVQLTQAGEVLLGHARTILSQMESARNSVRETEANPAGEVSVSMSASAANVLTLPVCKAVLERYPKINLNLEEGLTGNLIQWLRSGRIDLMIDFNIHDTGEFSHAPLLREDLFLFGHNLPDQETISFDRLPDYQLVLPTREHAMSKVLGAYEQTLGVTLSRFPAALGVYPMLSMVTSGIGNSVLPWSMIYNRIGLDGLRAVRVVDPEITRTSYLMSSRTHPLSSAAEAVKAIIISSVRKAWELGYWRGTLLLDEHAD
jgi:LysR family nitrogen assimilation transcriptional regulator